MSTDSTAPAPKRKAIGLFTSVGVIAVGLIAAGVSYLSRNIPAQIDFTDNNFYSLTEGTKKILAGVDTQVRATLFVSEGKDLPPELIGRVKDLESLLRQFEQKTPQGFFKLAKVNPAPDTEGGEQAALAGVQASPTRSGEVFLTLSIECLEKRENIDFLALMGREEQFEYEISRAIANVLKGDEKKKIGVMSALPLMGSMGPMMGGQQRPWIFFQQLKRDYDVQSIEMTVDKIDPALDALMVVHPAGLSDAGQFAIDQFVLSGKPVVMMLDSHSLVGKANAGRQNPQMGMMGGGEQTSSSVPKLTAAWGYGYDATQVVADMLFKTPLQGNRESPVFLTLGEAAFNRKDPATSGLSDLLFVFSGAFTGKPAEGLTEDILLRSSGQNEMVSPLEAENSDDAITQNFKSTGEPKTLALRLTGKFKTAFPEGKPKPAAADPAAKEDEEKKEEKKDDAGTALKEMAEGKTGVVLLVGDSDFLFDAFSVRMLGNMAMPLNGNLPFGLNIVDQIAGDTRLLEVRSRNSNRRPFTRINAIEAEANAKIQDAVAALQKKADDANTKLNNMQAAKDPNQRNFLSPEQQAEIESFRKTQAEAQREIRERRKSARADIDGTLASIKLWNIFGTPLVVAAIGVAVFFIRRKSTYAK